MVEVKLLQQGFQWTDLIAPAVTIIGVWLAYHLHRKRAKKELQREKAEKILGEVIELEKDFQIIKRRSDRYEYLCKNTDIINQQLIYLETLSKAYLFTSKISVEKLFGLTNSLRETLEKFCHSWSPIDDEYEQRQDTLSNQIDNCVENILNELAIFRDWLGNYIHSTE